jgi:predicted enzyme related to lactoylglutathione lyase
MPIYHYIVVQQFDLYLIYPDLSGKKMFITNRIIIFENELRKKYLKFYKQVVGPDLHHIAPSSRKKNYCQFSRDKKYHFSGYLNHHTKS